MISFALFILGAIVASFIGLVSVRLHTGQNVLLGRSRCDACNAVLHPLTLVPICSYMALRARALCCGAKIPWYAPLTEVVLGLLFVAAYVQIGLTLVLPFFLVALSLLGVLVLYDMAHQILPLPLLGLFFLVSVFTSFLLAPTLTLWYGVVLVALAIGLSLTLVHVLSSGRMMGFADGPFAFSLALLVGPAAFSGFVFSFWIGAVIGIGILWRRPAGSRMGVEVPFAPFLAAGFLLAYFTSWNPFILLAGLL